MFRTALFIALLGSSALAAPGPTHLMPKPVTVRDPGPGPTDPGVYNDYYCYYVFFDLKSRTVVKCKDQKPPSDEWLEKTKIPFQGGGWLRDKSGTWTFYPETGPQPKLPKPTPKESNGCCS